MKESLFSLSNSSLSMIVVTSARKPATFFGGYSRSTGGLMCYCYCHNWGIGPGGKTRELNSYHLQYRLFL